MSVRAPVGPVNLATEKLCIGRGLAAIRNGDGLDRDFLFYFLFSKQDEINGTEGAVFPSINKAEIEQISIAVPPLPEQQRIVRILDEAFEGVAYAKTNAEKNLQNTREVFESYLEEVFTSICEESELVPLSELSTDITDGDHMPPPKSLNGIPFITIGNIIKNTRKIDFTDTFMVPPSYYNGLKSNKKPKKGDVLYTVTGSFGIPVIVEEKIKFCFQRHIGLVRPKEETNSTWLYYLLSSPQVFRQASSGATGTAQKTVSLKVLRNITVPRIDLPKQMAIVARLDALSNATQYLKSIYLRKIAALDELIKSLLHRAFNGEL